MVHNAQRLKKVGLKATLPRVKILGILQHPDYQHSSVEDLYKKLLTMGEEIGIATIYRVLNQLHTAGLVIRHTFERYKSVFELSRQHHDHLICIHCGKVIEFQDAIIEKRQATIAQRYHIHLTSHTLYLYGYCTNNRCCIAHRNHLLVDKKTCYRTQ